MVGIGQRLESEHFKETFLSSKQLSNHLTQSSRQNAICNSTSIKSSEQGRDMIKVNMKIKVCNSLKSKISIHHKLGRTVASRRQEEPLQCLCFYMI